MKILWICPFRMYPVNSGGAHRAYNILRQLGRFHEVHAIIWQPAKDLVPADLPESIHLYSPKDQPAPRSLFDRLPRNIGPGLHYRWLRRCWKGPADNSFLACWHLIKEILSKQDIAVVVYEELGAMTGCRMIQRIRPNAGQIVNLYNVNHTLMAQTNQEHAEAAYKVEEGLADFVDNFWACSEADRELLSELNGLPGTVIPNGIDTLAFPQLPPIPYEEPIRLLFCGNMAHPPNEDGLRWFLDACWPSLQESGRFHFTIVGRGLEKIQIPAAEQDPNIAWVGEVYDVIPYYQECHIALAPLRQGSGTRLKILEAMSLGRPVVATPIGAEGLEAENGVHLVIAECKNFSSALIKLAENPDLLASITTSARKHVETQYDWNHIGTKMQQVLQEAAGS